MSRNLYSHPHPLDRLPNLQNPQRPLLHSSRSPTMYLKSSLQSHPRPMERNGHPDCNKYQNKHSGSRSDSIPCQCCLKSILMNRILSGKLHWNRLHNNMVFRPRNPIPRRRDADHPIYNSDKYVHLPVNWCQDPCSHPPPDHSIHHLNTRYQHTVTCSHNYH